MDSLQGKLLIASPKLLDPNFIQSVLVIVQHDDSGALGLILNRPLDTTVRAACEDLVESPCNIEGFLFQGGPCEGVLMALHTHSTAADIKVMSGLYFATERDKIEWLLEHNSGDLKMFVGYAGWSPGQLDSEMETGSWLTLPATAEHVFASDPRQWKRLLTEANLSAWVDPSRIPEDPSVN